jgi:RHS repeat-associated protein
MTQTKTGPDGVTVTTLDGLGRVVRVSRGDSNGAQSYADTVYAPCACSPLGKLQQVSQPYAPNATPVWTVYTYDGIGRTVSVRQPDGGSTTSYSYSGNQTTVTDPGTTTDPVSGNPVAITKTFTSDAFGNLTSVSEPDPANPATASLITTYTYDWMNHVSCVDMVRGGTLVAATTYTANGLPCNTVYSGGTRQTRTFAYNDTGLLTAATNPENGTVLYYYNADNTLNYKHDARGQETVYGYDTYKRIRQYQVFPTGQNNPADPCQGAFYSWDGSFSTPNYNVGRISMIEYGDYAASTSCVPGTPGMYYVDWINYDAGGRVANKRTEMHRNNGRDYGSVTSTYGYDSLGRLSFVSYPMATPFAQTGASMGTDWFIYGYDSMSRPISMTGPAPDGSGGSSTWVQGVQYDAASRMTQIQYIAGASGPSPIYTTENMSYNANGQMLTQSWSTPSSLGPTGALAYSYAAAGQNNGQITQVSDTISGETIQYKYDSLKRLTSATSTPQSGSPVQAWTENFQFDGFGNLTGKVLNGNPTAIGVNAATNQLTNAGYDPSGNMISGLGASFAYDGLNRMVSAAEVSGGTEYYGYGPDNKRMYRRKADGTEEWTFYGGSGEKLGVFQYSTSAGFYPVRSTVSFAGRTIISDGFPVFQDRLGTNRASGARFYPYGEEITSTANDRVKFGTYTRDSYTGLDYADQRFYASSYGRFNTPDPARSSAGASDPGSWNRYAYTRGDPVNRKDPRGLEDCDTAYALIEGCTGDPNDYCGSDPSDPDCIGQPAPGESICNEDPMTLALADPEANQGCFGQTPPQPTQPSAPASCTNWGCMPAAEAQALFDLADKPGCASNFNGHDPAAVLEDIISGTAYGNISFDLLSPVVAAVTDQHRSAIRRGFAKTATITINTYVDPSAVYWNTGNADYNAITLLHELGHVFQWEFGQSSTTIVFDANRNGSPNVGSEAANAAALRACGP